MRFFAVNVRNAIGEKMCGYISERLHEFDERALVVVRQLGAEQVATVEYEIGRLIPADEPLEERFVREDIEDDAIARDRGYLAWVDARDKVDRRAGRHLERPVAVRDTQLGVNRGDAD